MYKLCNFENVVTIKRLSDNAFIPKVEGNRDYQQFLQDIKVHTISIVEGEDVIEPDYVKLRIDGDDGYKSISEQLDMQYKNDGTWEAHIAAVKTAYPKSITGGTTIAAVPDWVQAAADAVELQENP